MAYSIDGQEKIPLHVEVKQARDWNPFIGVINESVTLPPLTRGSHSITVFGDLAVHGSHLSQATVYFTV